MAKIEDIEAWISENSDSAGFYDTEALVNHFEEIAKKEFTEKALGWICENLCYYDENGFDSNGDGILKAFNQAMMEE